MRSESLKSLAAAALLGTAAHAQTDLALARTPGADPGPGIPACSEQPGWFSLFDGTGASIEKYFFNPSGQFHGSNSRWWVTGGTLYSDQSSDRKGGCIYTKRQYKNVEFKTNVKPYWGNDAGYFFRANTSGRAYQVVVDYIAGSTKAIGGIYGEARPSGQDINYKPYGFTSPTAITLRSEWYSDGLEGRPKLTAADWNGKIWKPNDFNWVSAKIYNGDVPIIDTWINHEYQMIRYQDPANKAANEQQTGHVTIQVHTGSGNWSINNPNQYKAILIREVQANGQPLASYPEWQAVCSTPVARAAAPANRAASVAWRVRDGGVMEMDGQAPAAYTLSLADAGGRVVRTFAGGAGAFSHSAAIRPGSIHFLTVRAAGHSQTYKVVGAGT